MGSPYTQSPPAMSTPDVQRPDTECEASDTSLSYAVATMRKQRWVLILATVLGVSCGTYKAHTQPASGAIQVHNGISSGYKLTAAYDFNSSQQNRMNAAVAILKSESLPGAVAREINLANNPHVVDSAPPAANPTDAKGVW